MGKKNWEKGEGDERNYTIPGYKKKPCYILQERSVLLLCLGSASGFVLSFTQELTFPQQDITGLVAHRAGNLIQ